MGFLVYCFSRSCIINFHMSARLFEKKFYTFSELSIFLLYQEKKKKKKGKCSQHIFGMRFSDILLILLYVCDFTLAFPVCNIAFCHGTGAILFPKRMPVPCLVSAFGFAKAIA